MTIAFVLGNGISRAEIQVNELQKYGSIYGCNALYRTAKPTVLIATDQPIATAIQDSGYALKNRFYTRRPIDGLGAVRIPASYYGYSSGPIAVGIAAMDRVQRIYMLGFDMGPTENNKINNLYAGTEYYKSADSQPTYTGNWIRQITKIVNEYPKTKFVRVCGPTTAKILELNALPNLAHIDIDSFQNRINNQKDL